MTIQLPKRLKTQRTAETGINIVSTIFNDQYGWIFRRTHQEHDFGIDAYIDFVTDEGDVTGKFIAAQIKTGASYLSPNGDVHWYHDTNAHLNYFLNSPTPILLIICDPNSAECFWAILDKDEIDFQDKKWRHPVPKTQRLDDESKQSIQRLFGDIEDHVSDFNADIDFLNQIEEDSFIQYAVPKKDIEKLDFENLKSFLKRITRSEKLTLAIQSKLYVATYGYESDKRETHQIPEIRRWAKKAREEIEEWYLCAGNPHISTLAWIVGCSCKGKMKSTKTRNGKVRYQFHADVNDLKVFQDKCWVGLNNATDKWGWSETYNYEISKLITGELFPQFQFPKLSGKPKRSTENNETV